MKNLEINTSTTNNNSIIEKKYKKIKIQYNKIKSENLKLKEKLELMITKLSTMKKDSEISVHIQESDNYVSKVLKEKVLLINKYLKD